ncbi:nicotinamidase-related amidase [Sphingomonas sp. BE270]|jgi:nicotinamidase-related amidase|uniref:isochorismatase family protein n=1 Tax=unclassified Sphingomonas TaxID=196159 RepID=UPI00053EB181|nr:MULTISPECIES: isochorismatase family protein [unclassified Sphingomonas]MDR6847555.1 nicotinamidase-related amidase [Sphingomonas sp. BE137]MDR7257587.1 nicotinamidase-related amidase [Sphingomonas sp. BE270]
MALTTLDPKTALIVVDLQKGIVTYPVVHSIEQVIDRSRALIEAFRARGLPVVLVNVTGGAPGRTERPQRDMSALPADFADLVPELGLQPSDILVTKQSWGAFAGTDLDQRLKALGVTQVVICGIATATGVEATARQAYENGFNVTLAIDAMSDTRPEAHDYSIRNVFPRLGETGCTDDILSHLERCS